MIGRQRFCYRCRAQALPETDNLSGQALLILGADQRPFKDGIGEQVVLCGMLEWPRERGYIDNELGGCGVLKP